MTRKTGRTDRSDRSSQRRSPQHNWTLVGGGIEPTDEERGIEERDLPGGGRAWDGRVKGYERGPLGMNGYVQKDPVGLLNDIA